MTLCYISVACMQVSSTTLLEGIQQTVRQKRTAELMIKGLAVIVLVGALVIAAEGACTFNKWDTVDGIPFFYNIVTVIRVNNTIILL